MSAVQVTLSAPDKIFGSALYSVSVTIRNASVSEIIGVEVEPISLSGSLLARDVEVADVDEDELGARRRSLVEEMENQVATAYESQKIRDLPFIEQLAYATLRAGDVYASAFAGRRVSTMLPSWSKQAFRIHDWADVEALEATIISRESDDSAIRRAFIIDKHKLERCLVALNTRDATSPPFPSGTTLVPGSSITVPFRARAPHQFRQDLAELQFKITYRDANSGKVTTESVGQSLTVIPSAFAVPTGAMLGAMAGYGIKIALQKPTTETVAFNAITFGGCVLLALIIALLTSRRPETFKPITVEDFVGGLLIGAFTGMFSESIFDRLRLIVAGTE